MLTAAPASVPPTDAAALPSVALTARQALFDDGGLVAGQRVLVNGAGRAVGGDAVQPSPAGCRRPSCPPGRPRALRGEVVVVAGAA